ncbi:MAG: lactate utilization protein [Desulfovibrio sp.]|jgi:L-lactate utilization protein LutB|nr:lactate utilization protein [Desulfovibrio sp.]
MDVNMQWLRETRAKNAAAALEKNGFAAVWFAKGEDAVTHILGLVPDKASVGLGGSATVRSLGLIEALAGKDCTLLDHSAPGLSPEQRQEIRRRQLISDVFLCSSNAVTLNGELVNVDGTGNRAAAMMFGPGKVIVVAGVNKVVNTVEEARARIRTFAAPANNKRLNSDNPCTHTGHCMDCRNKTRYCNITTIIHRRPLLTDIHTVIIGEELGF